VSGYITTVTTRTTNHRCVHKYCCCNYQQQ